MSVLNIPSKRILSFLVFLALSTMASAQEWAIGTNVLDYCNLGTLNIEGSVAFSRHFSADIGYKYNPWSFGDKSSPSTVFFNKQQTLYADIRYYPWFAFDGWYISVVGGWMEYASGGIFSQKTEEGDAFGGGVGFGYTLIIHKNLNLNMGGSVWAGTKNYSVYQCPVCGRPEERGTKGFIMPFNLNVSLSWVFSTPKNKETRIDKNRRKIYKKK